MTDLVEIYDEKSVTTRVKQKLDEFFDAKMMCDFPNYDKFLNECSRRVAFYLRFVIKAEGEEKAPVAHCVKDLEATMNVLEMSGILRGGACIDWCNTMRKIVFDELRRHGVLQYNGMFERC